MSDVQHVEAAIGQYDALSSILVLRDPQDQRFEPQNLVSRVHYFCVPIIMPPTYLVAALGVLTRAKHILLTASARQETTFTTKNAGRNYRPRALGIARS